MANDRWMTIHFNDGTKLKFDFPEQAKHPLAKQTKLAEFLAGRSVIVQAEDQVFVFPATSIKYLTFSAAGMKPLGDAMPKQAIVQARLRD